MKKKKSVKKLVKRVIKKPVRKVKNKKQVIKKKNAKIKKKLNIKKIKNKKIRRNIKKLIKKSKRILRKVKILKELPRAGTGIKGFDSMIEKGFERNSINLIVGGSGSGKTIFGMQFLIDGIKRGETVMYVTFEEKRDEFYKNMKDFGWDLKKL